MPGGQGWQRASWGSPESGLPTMPSHHRQARWDEWPTSAPLEQDPEERPQRVVLPVAHHGGCLDGERSVARQQPLAERVQAQLAAHRARLASPEGAREGLGDGHVTRCWRLHPRQRSPTESVAASSLEKVAERAARLRAAVEGWCGQGGAIGEALDGHLRLRRTLAAGDRDGDVEALHLQRDLDSHALIVLAGRGPGRRIAVVAELALATSEVGAALHAEAIAGIGKIAGRGGRTADRAGGLSQVSRTGRAGTRAVVGNVAWTGSVPAGRGAGRERVGGALGPGARAVLGDVAWAGSVPADRGAGCERVGGALGTGAGATLGDVAHACGAAADEADRTEGVRRAGRGGTGARLRHVAHTCGLTADRVG